MNHKEQISPYTFFTVMTLGISLVVGLVAWSYQGLPPLLSYLVGVNVGSFFAMGFDKSYARSNALRIPEVVLYGIALIGGSAGTLIACHLLRHKTRKAKFQFVLILILAIQVGIMSYLKIQFR